MASNNIMNDSAIDKVKDYFNIFLDMDDDELFNNALRLKRDFSYENLPEYMALISEVCDRRCNPGGLWNLFEWDEYAIRLLFNADNSIDGNNIACEIKSIKDRIESGEDINKIFVSAKIYSLIRSKTTYKQRPFDVQLLGALVLYHGNVAEMKTGEGKTLVAAITACLRCTNGNNVHIVTTNDYLAKRDKEWMENIFGFLGFKSGVLQYHLNYKERQEQYACNIVYGSNNEFGFDYLRDNLVTYKDQIVQPDVLDFVIIDEVDSVLIDEARVPLVISGQSSQTSDWFFKIDKVIRRLIRKDKYYTIEGRTCLFTKKGKEYLSEICNTINCSYKDISYYADILLKAHLLFKKDREYVVIDDKVIIVDEHTGRLMHGRRYKEGIHQAIEAKEGVFIEKESEILGTITFQNYFKLYKIISGMTGTAKTQEEEFKKLYKMDVICIIPNSKVIRKDYNDRIFISESIKYKNVVSKIKECYEKGQPILVGTKSVEKSELLSMLIARENIPHKVLNAKYHKEEAEIISKAGDLKSVVIATNMAGRGTDIKVDKEALKLGGLLIFGTERHDSQRIDNQLRGRTGRQGEDGETQFYISIDDDLFKDRNDILKELELDGSPEIKSKYIIRYIDQIQKDVEYKNSLVRNQLLEYDNAFKLYREKIYALRKDVLLNNNCCYIIDFMESLMEELYLLYEDDNVDAMNKSAEILFCENFDVDNFDKLRKKIFNKYHSVVDGLKDNKNNIEKTILLRMIDKHWIRFLNKIDALRTDVKKENDAIEIFKTTCEKSFNNVSYNIREDSVYLFFNKNNAEEN